MSRKKLNLYIKLWNIKVDDRYYSYNYFIKIEGKKVDEGKCSDGHNWSDDKEVFKEHIKEHEWRQILIRWLE